MEGVVDRGVVNPDSKISKDHIALLAVLLGVLKWKATWE
jgi:hypothetical protein